MPVLKRYISQSVLLLEIEATEGTDSAPTPSANAILARNIKVKANQAAFRDARDNYTTYIGDQGSLEAVYYGELEFDVELQGSGTAGTAPRFGPALRACGLQQVIVATTSVTYTPVSINHETVTIWLYVDGVLRKFVGCKGNLKVSFVPGKVPLLKFKLMGIQPAVGSSASTPTPSLGTIPTPLIANDAVTTSAIFTLTTQAPSFQIDFDLGHTPKLYLPFNQTQIIIPDRSVKVGAKFQAGSLATKDWDTIRRNRTRGEIAVTHGITAGLRATIKAPYCELDDQPEADQDGVLLYDYAFTSVQNAGNDEFSLAFT